MGYSLEVCKELDTTEATQHVLFKVHVLNLAYKSLRDPAPPSPITLLPTLLGFCPLATVFLFFYFMHVFTSSLPRALA